MHLKISFAYLYHISRGTLPITIVLSLVFHKLDIQKHTLYPKCGTSIFKSLTLTLFVYNNRGSLKVISNMQETFTELKLLLKRIT